MHPLQQGTNSAKTEEKTWKPQHKILVENGL